MSNYPVTLLLSGAAKDAWAQAEEGSWEDHLLSCENENVEPSSVYHVRPVILSGTASKITIATETELVNLCTSLMLSTFAEVNPRMHRNVVTNMQRVLSTVVLSTGAEYRIIELELMPQ